MKTYFIRAAYPLSESHRDLLNDEHRKNTSAQLTILPNAAGTECLIKVKTNLRTKAKVPNNLLPPGLTALDVLDDKDEVRELLGSTTWTTP